MEDFAANEAWVVGDGNKIRVWEEKWMDAATRLEDIMENIPLYMRDWRLRDMVDDGGNWKWEELAIVLPETVVQRLLAIHPPSHDNGPDQRI